MNDPIPFIAFDRQSDFALAHEHVLARWLGYVHDAEPWRSMAPDDVMGYLRPITIAVLGAERDPDERRRMHTLHVAALRHAAFRGAQRCSRRVVHQELVALKAAIRVEIEQSGTDAMSAGLLADLADAELRLVRRSIRRGLRGRSRNTGWTTSPLSIR